MPALIPGWNLWSDYLWNITSTMSGYNPDRIFDLIGSVGVNLAYTSKSDRH